MVHTTNITPFTNSRQLELDGAYILDRTNFRIKDLVLPKQKAPVKLLGVDVIAHKKEEHL
jgi:hypothetical protein